MGIKMLIERLNQYSQSLIAYKLGADFADACMDAATVLSTLQAENEKLWAELEQVKRERDAAVKDLEKLCRDDVGPCEMTICELCAYNNGAQCSRNDGQICDGYDVFNWKWRGQKKED